MNNKVMRDLLVLSAVVLATLLPFVNKPFNVDDPFYLAAANQLIKDPLHPYSYSINWSGELRDVWGKMEATFPPLVTAYTAVISMIFGQKEWVLHLFFLVFPFSAAAAMYFIAKKFVKAPLFAALLFAVCPSFLVSATSIMLDVPLCALMLCSTALFIYGADSGDKRQLILGSAVAGLAVLAKYSGILVIPVLVLYLLFSKKLKYAVYLLIPFAFLGLWCLHNEIVYGGMHFLLASGHIGKGVSLHKIFSFGTFFSGCLVFPVLLLFAADLKEARALAVWALVLFVFGKLVLGDTGVSVLFAVFCTASLYFIYAAVLKSKLIDRFVLAWFFTGFLAVIILEPWMSARYLLIILPPAAIIFAKILETLTEKRAKALSCASFSAVLVLGISVAVADYIWADSYKALSGYVQDKGCNTGYFLGHFGFQYYLEKAGMTALEVNKPLPGGGYLIAAKIPDPQRPSSETSSRLKLKELKPLKSAFPLRLMNPKLRVGFYSSYWGILPFNFSTAPLDEIAIFEIGGERHL